MVNIKYKRYRGLPYLIYFVLVGNSKISNEDIAKIINNRKNKLDSNIYVVEDTDFKLNLNKYLHKDRGEQEALLK